MERTTDTVATGLLQRVLLAEDDTDLRGLLAMELERGGYEVVQCSSGAELVQTLDLHAGCGGIEDYAAVITDIRMPGVTGMELLEGLGALGRHCPIILITGFGDEETHRMAKHLGAAAVLDKPFDSRELLRVLTRVTSLRRRLSAVWGGEGDDGT